MAGGVRSELHDGLLEASLERRAWTARAWHLLPPLDRPSILDIGCGRGGPTLQLAELSQGQIWGIDVDMAALRILAHRTSEAGLINRVRPIQGSLFALSFAGQSFDLLWSEGAIWLLGFAPGLRQWRRLLRPGGCLVVHEAIWLRPDPPPEVRAYWQRHYAGISTIPPILDQIPACGYDLLGHFALPEDAWWRAYYAPLERRIQTLRDKYAADPASLALLDAEQRDVDLFKCHQPWYGSAFFVLQRSDSGLT